MDDSTLEALRRALPQRLFEKDVEPALERNRKEGLTSAEVQALADRLATIGRALDSKTGRLVMDLFHTLNKEQGKTIILITHNPELAAETGRVLTMVDGMLYAEGGAAHGTA